MTLAGIFRSQLYLLMAGAFLGFLFLSLAVSLALLGFITCRDPETGIVYLHPTWFSTWIFASGLLATVYAAVAFLSLAVALWRFCRGKNEAFALTLGSYLLLPIFPFGTFFCFHALARLASSRGEPASVPDQKSKFNNHHS